MKQKRYHYAVLEIALYSSFGLFALEHAINTFAVEGWNIMPNFAYMNLTEGTNYQFGIRYIRETGAAMITDGRCEILVAPR